MVSSHRSAYHDDEEGESDADSAETGEEELAEAQKRVRVEEVWRDMILTSNGRDKAFVRALSPFFLRRNANGITETNTIYPKAVPPLPPFPLLQPAVQA